MLVRNFDQNWNFVPAVYLSLTPHSDSQLEKGVEPIPGQGLWRHSAPRKRSSSNLNLVSNQASK